MLERFEQFSYYISNIYQTIQKIERDEMVKYGLKGPYAQYLAAMRRFPDGVTAAQLCGICEKDKAAVSRALAEMEARGLLVRRAVQDTAYRARVRLTEKGQQAANYVCQKATAAVELAGRGLSESERAVFYDVLSRIAANLQTVSRTGLPSPQVEET